MNKITQTEKLSNILKNIGYELTENSNIKNQIEERITKIKKAFSYIEKQMNQYVSKFSFDVKNLENGKYLNLNKIIFLLKKI